MPCPRLFLALLKFLPLFVRYRMRGTTKHTKNTKKKPKNGDAMEIVYKDESYRIMGACFEYERIVL
jgi:hypothetical protein